MQIFLNLLENLAGINNERSLNRTSIRNEYVDSHNFLFYYCFCRTCSCYILYWAVKAH